MVESAPARPMMNLHQNHPTFAFNPSSHMATQSSLDCSDAQGLVISRLNQSTIHPRVTGGGGRGGEGRGNPERAV